MSGPPVQVGPALPDSGFCNACSSDDMGQMPKRPTMFVRLASQTSSGGMVFRLCDVHAKDLIAQLKHWLT